MRNYKCNLKNVKKTLLKPRNVKKNVYAEGHANSQAFEVTKPFYADLSTCDVGALLYPSTTLSCGFQVF